MTNSGLGSNKVVFGTSQLLRGVFDGKIYSILNAAFDSGIRHFDTARLYGFGDAEAKIGHAIMSWPEKVVISTKFGLKFNQPGYFKKKFFLMGRLLKSAFPNSTRKLVEKNAPKQFHDFSLEASRESFEKSLFFLKVQFIDFLFLHEPFHDSNIPDETIRFLEGLVASGKIGAFGGSGALCDLMVLQEKFNLNFTCLQFPSNCLNQNQSFEIGTIKFAFNVVKPVLEFLDLKKGNGFKSFDKNCFVAALLRERISSAGFDKVLFNSSRVKVIRDVMSLFNSPFDWEAYLQECFKNA